MRKSEETNVLVLTKAVTNILFGNNKFFTFILKGAKIMRPLYSKNRCLKEKTRLLLGLIILTYK
jgi:hypothetical protein